MVKFIKFRHGFLYETICVFTDRWCLIKVILIKRKQFQTPHIWQHLHDYLVPTNVSRICTAALSDS